MQALADTPQSDRRARIGMRTAAVLQSGATIWDTDVVGFGVRRQKRAVSYILKYRFGRRQRWLTIGRHGAPWTPETARREARRLLGLVASGLDPAVQREATRSMATVSELAQRFLKEHVRPRRKARTVETYEMLVRVQIEPKLGHLRLNELTRADVGKWHRDLGTVRANRALSLLRAMFNKAEAWGMVPDGTNPARKVEPFPERPRERFLSPQEIARLGDALRVAEQADTVHPSAIALFRLLLLTGTRLSEIATARWDWVDLEGGCLRLPDSKTGAKIVPLGAAAREVLAHIPRRKGNAFVIAGEKKGCRFIGIQKSWQRLRKSAKLPDLRLHDLRHSFASIAVAAGDSLFLVGKVLGHKQASTTERYAHLYNDPLRAVADRTAGSIATLLDGSADAPGGDGGKVVPIAGVRRT